MAHTKSKGTSKLGRDSQAQRLGVKIFGGQKIKKGMIIIRQRGTKYHPDLNVRRAGDDSLFALCDGVVKFLKKKARSFTGKLEKRTFVRVETK